MASLSNQPVTRALAEQTLQDFFTTDVEIKPTDIISQVAKYFHLTFEDLVGKSRTKNVAVPRQIAMYLARENDQYEPDGYWPGLWRTRSHHSNACLHSNQ